MFGTDLSRAVLECATLPEVLSHRAATESGPAFRFLVDGTRASARDWTYQDLAGAVDAVATDLVRRGLTGQRVVLALEPGLAYLACLYGLLRAGAVAVPSFPPRGDRAKKRLESIVKDCRPAAIMLDRVSAEYPGMQAIRVDEEYLAPVWEVAEFARLNPSDLALLQYTSGSTGHPRGVMLTHTNVVSNCRTLIDRMGVESDRVGCTWLPPYHDMGLLGTLLLSVYGGWPVIMLSPGHFVQQPERWLRAISEHGVTASVAPNFALDLCVERIPDDVFLNLGTLRQLYCGAEPVLASTIERFYHRFKAHGLAETVILPSYGLAEATLFVSGKQRCGPPRIENVDRGLLESGQARPARRDDATAARVVSCGPPARGHEVVVVDPKTCRPRPEGEVGEIWVSGPNVASGYFNAGNEGPNNFAARLYRRGGWARTYLRTGDLGFQLDGELFVTGRIKDVIVVDGRNLYPHDVEESAIRAWPQLRVAVAFSVGELGERERLVVVGELRSRSSPPSEALGAATLSIRTAVNHEHGVVPADVHIGPIGVIETTTSGKLCRTATRQAYLTQSLKPFYLSPGVTR
ncbi:MAG TPA: fatty acyl-AMP ligase [Candidatus Limnocylindrales bacterium]|nr:fatty acyl-AMP ligase [Candidatus Limnocylindrales bacterium]